MNRIDIKPMPMIKKPCFFMKDGIGNFKLTNLFKNLEMDDMVGLGSDGSGLKTNFFYLANFFLNYIIWNSETW